MSGNTTVSFRLWRRRPKVRPGGRYPLGLAQIEVDSVELMPFAAIAPADIRRSCAGGRPMRARSLTIRCSAGWSSTSSARQHCQSDTDLLRAALHRDDGPARSSSVTELGSRPYHAPRQQPRRLTNNIRGSGAAQP